MAKYKLGEAFILKAGKSIKAVNISEDKTLYPCYGGNGLRGYTDTYTHDGEYNLIGRQGALCGNVQLATGKFYATEHAVVVKPVIENCDPQWLYYALTGMKLNQYATGAAQPGLSVENLSKLEITIPGIEEQKKQAAVLEHIQGVINHRQQQRQALDDLVKSQFIEMFGDPVENPKGWAKEPLGKHAEIMAGKPFDSKGYTDEGINICGGLIIMPDRIAWEDCKHWPTTEGLEQFLLAEDDIVLAMDRPWISEGFKIAKIKESELPSLLIQRTARIRGIDLDQDFLLNMIKHPEFEIHCNITATTVPHISMKDISTYPVLVPPMELQKKYAELVHQSDKSKFTVQQSLDKMQFLFDSLMQQYFG